MRPPDDPLDATADPFEAARSSAAAIRDALGEHRVAIVLGSGWAAAADELGSVLDRREGLELGLEPPGVPGHRSTVTSVALERDPGASERALVLAGRVHLYEGHPVERVVHQVRAAVLAGASTVVLTNAAGSLRRTVGIGSVVAITDQLNLTGENPMCGAAPDPPLPGRFVDLTDLYSARLRSGLQGARPGLADGVYAGLRGASFETPAEIRMLRTMGADLVGMSTVLEAVAARHLGAEVVGLSLVTNLAAGMQPGIDHLEVLDAAAVALADLVDVLDAVVGLGGG